MLRSTKVTAQIDKKQVLLKTGYKRLYYISIFPRGYHVPHQFFET
jgi:hypothetical protein